MSDNLELRVGVTDFQLRDFGMADFEALYLLDQACFEPGIAYSRQQLWQFLSLSSAQAVVAESRGAIVGFAVGHASGRRVGRVVTLDVAQAHRRGGIGRALLEELVRRLAAAPVEEVRLEVDMDNEAAIAFYERFGFRKRRRLADYYGPRRPAWEMALEVRGLRAEKGRNPG